MDRDDDVVVTAAQASSPVTATVGTKLSKSLSVDSICSQKNGVVGGSGGNGSGSGGVALKLGSKKVHDLDKNRYKHAAGTKSSFELNRNKSNGSLNQNTTTTNSKNTSMSITDRPPPLSLMQKLLLDEQSIYSDPNDNYKRRTIVLVRPKPNGVNFSLFK